MFPFKILFHPLTTPCLNTSRPQSYRGKQKFFNSLSVEEVGGGQGEPGQVPPSSDGSLKVNKCGKQPNRWSGLWGGSNKVRRGWLDGEETSKLNLSQSAVMKFPSKIVRNKGCCYTAAIIPHNLRSNHRNYSGEYFVQIMKLRVDYTLHLTVQDQKMEGLVVQLDNYSRLGIPKLHHLAMFPDPAEDLVEEGNPCSPAWH